ncbi:membrane integrity-associated transporter subunit PqiC [Burkholderia sp. L27(2015)]|uniref:PqiC family protein n=1 Tax=Burkholderia sp. L27(2015) TaxID=1641858 RepID=UPI001576C37E|nr:PqiC family protein [Burkholderia sp. L27(2015)]
MRSLLLMPVVLTLALVGGCGSSPTASFYTLSPVRPQEHVDTGTPVAITIGIVTVPEIVDRPQLVLRVDANQVALAEFDRWADPLKSQIRRVIAADLALQFPGALVSGYSQSVDPASTYLVSIDVQSFESAPGDAASITVLWSVRPPKLGAPMSGRTVVREPTGGAGDEALVAAHSRALAAVSRDIAAALRSTLRQ